MNSEPEKDPKPLAIGWRRPSWVGCARCHLPGLASGIDWIFSDNLSWALYWGRVRGDPPPWHSLGFFIADRPWLSQLSALFIVCFEVGFPLALFFKKVRPAFVTAAWLFHGGTFLMLGLDYWLWALVVTLVLVDWPKVVDRVRRQPVPAPA